MTARKGVEKKEARDFVALQSQQATQIHLMDRAAARKRKELAAEQARINLEIANERRARKGVPEGVVTTNEVSDSFYAQFGRSHR
mmetsp:Transcript_19646/g.58616  ORF Transcript_19646/g.58616 Transcript_19646/m.58616 type:complete len:85 (-) Transcript_19646:97-351(-)